MLLNAVLGPKGVGEEGIGKKRHPAGTADVSLESVAQQ